MDTKIIEVKKQTLTIDNEAQELEIKSQSNYDKTNEFLKAIKMLQAKIKAIFEPMKAKSYAAWKEICANENRLLELPIKAEALTKNKMLDYIREQEKIRQEAERKLQAEAERKRQEALEKAEAARAEGKEAKAERFEEKASQIVSPVLSSTVDQGGVSTRKTYSAQVVNLRALVEAVVANKAPLGLIEANQVALNSQARSLKESMDYPGIKLIIEDSLISARR